MKVSATCLMLFTQAFGLWGKDLGLITPISATAFEEAGSASRELKNKKCVDNASFKFFKKENGCEHVAAKKRKRCKKVIKGKKVADMCPKTCGTCPTEPKDVCVKEKDAMKTVKAFMNTVPGISEAYFGASPPGGPAKTIKEVMDGDTSNEAGCKAAYDVAIGALNAAYAYDYGDVLFKPTLTAVPYTYRNNLEGALSYFIGTECLYHTGVHEYPEGNANGEIFQEYGFGINNYDGKTGWDSSFAQDFTFMTSEESQVNCDTALAIGRICFVPTGVSKNTFGSGYNGTLSCVDKTFSFKNSPKKNPPLKALITSHHSSISIVDNPDPIMYCQDPIYGFQPDQLVDFNEKITVCENKEEPPIVEPPIVETPNNNRTLNETLEMTMELRDEIRANHNFVAEDRDDCYAQTDAHQRCVYEMFTPSADFACECQPKSGAGLFDAVDANEDGYVTFEEIQNYFDQDPCEPSFIYDGITYTGCTTVGDVHGREWCSIQTLKDGTHAYGFWKYCNSEDNFISWKEALVAYDSDNDDRLSFDEAVTKYDGLNGRRRRRLTSSVSGFSAEANCNDCSNTEDAYLCLTNPVMWAIDGECRNYIKSVPFDHTDEDDEHLLYMLGIAMSDVYCTEEDEDNYLGCTARRDGTEEWMTQTHLSPYPDNDGWVVVLSCLAVAGAQTDTVQNLIRDYAATYVGPVVASAGVFLLNRFLSVAAAALECERVFREITDGRDALQWATYRINQGKYEGKTILAYMGTDFGSNPEQVVADIWSVPFGNNMMRNMTDEAVEIANGIVEEAGGKENVFITGHSLGGIVAELVCSETGIAGASFAAIGAFDPFSRVDEAVVDALVEDTELSVDVLDRYRKMLEGDGFETEEIEAALENIDREAVRSMLVAAEYNGLVRNTQHAGVKFEVVMNQYDILARSVASIDGSMCSHIASSCDLRWTWFGDGFGLENKLGHSSKNYMYNTNSYFTRGWEDESHAIIDYNKIFLPGQKGNVVCDACWDGRNEYCASGNCFAVEGECRNAGSSTLPTFCPANSTRSGQRSDCVSHNDCESGRCDGHSNIYWNHRGYQQCYEKSQRGDICNEDSDCLSNNCNWWFRCS